MSIVIGRIGNEDAVWCTCDNCKKSTSKPVKASADAVSEFDGFVTIAENTHVCSDCYERIEENGNLEREKENLMRYLIDKLNKASKAYYAEDKEIMSNYEYDALYDELVKLEGETGIVLDNSPTVNVGYECVDYLVKERHEKPMLSLAKTKDRDELVDWVGNQTALLSWKLDGLTVVLTYENGELVKGVTRGNGEIGEVVTHSVKAFTNVPRKINHKGRLIVRGEAVISYADFEKIKSEPGNENYKNPRNLCSGSVRQLDANITKKRKVQFMAFTLVEAQGMEFTKHSEEFEFLHSLGFDVVAFKKVTADNLKNVIEQLSVEVETYEIPSDGLVLLYDDIKYGESLGTTSKSPRNSIAFKWQDEVAETTLRDIEWSPSRTGLLNPVAIFDTVDLEGTEVSRASLHNISYMRDMKLGIGDRIKVYKANMIIPQLSENLTKSDNFEIPSICPCCGGATRVQKDNESEVLLCTNEDCPAKKIKAFSQFVSRNAMNIDGISDSTLEKFVALGVLHTFADIYRLKDYKEKICSLEGYGEKSFNKLMANIDASRKTNLSRLLYALGIPGVGTSTGKLIARAFHNDLDTVMAADEDDYMNIEGIGMEMASDIVRYFKDADNISQLKELCNYLTFTVETKAVMSKPEVDLTGKTFVITGSLNHFVNRDELKAIIESAGGKAGGSVSAKTTALINNDILSNSSKNKTAKSLGIEIISEEDFMARYKVSGTK